MASKSMSRVEDVKGAVANTEREMVEGEGDGDGGARTNAAGEVHLRPVLHITKLREHLEWGDIVLFRSNNSLSGLQRSVTRAEWDHVALVVRSPYGSSLDLLESTAEGVTSYPLVSRIRAYSHGFTK